MIRDPPSLPSFIYPEPEVSSQSVGTDRDNREHYLACTPLRKSVQTFIFSNFCSILYMISVIHQVNVKTARLLSREVLHKTWS